MIRASSEVDQEESCYLLGCCASINCACRAGPRPVRRHCRANGYNGRQNGTSRSGKLTVLTVDGLQVGGQR